MPEPSKQTPPQPGYIQGKLILLTRSVGQFFEGIAWLTEKVIGILRLLAISTLFMVVLFVVYRAIQSSDVIDVKPVSVPRSMLDEHAEAGRIVSNVLKSYLKQEEYKYVSAINGRIIESSTSFDSSIADQQLTSGGDIKIPQTGISINDVVEFISSLFGKQSISGSVYEDSEKLYLQLVLKDRVLTFDAPLVAGKSRLVLLEEMLRQQSTKKILSVAFENYNLYYYCNGEVNTIERHRGHYKKWFDYCKTVKDLDSEEKILALQRQLNRYDPKAVRKEDQLAVHTLTQINRIIDNKLQLVQQAKTDAITRPPQASATLQPSAPATVTATEPVTSRVVERAAPLVSEPSVPVAETKSPSLINELRNTCEEPANPQKSSRKEADGMLLYKLGLYEDAISKYREAIQADCNNAKAWASLGMLYTSAEDKAYQDAEKAIALLTQAGHLNHRAGWIQHQLCIAETFFNGINTMPSTNMESALTEVLNKESCQQARLLEPANAVLYDKLFYLALADHYYQNDKPEQAFTLYIKSLQIDKRADCHMDTVIERLKRFTSNDKPVRAEQEVCGVLKQAYFIEEKPDGCQANLKRIKSQCP